MRLCPFVTELVFHQREPHQGILGRADTSCGLEADFEVGSLMIIANGANLNLESARTRQDECGCRNVVGNYHAESGFKSCIDAFFPGRCLDEIRTSHHAYKRRLHYFLHGSAFTRGQNDLDVRVTAGVPHQSRLSAAMV